MNTFSLRLSEKRLISGCRKSLAAHDLAVVLDSHVPPTVPVRPSVVDFRNRTMRWAVVAVLVAIALEKVEKEGK